MIVRQITSSYSHECMMKDERWVAIKALTMSITDNCSHKSSLYTENIMKLKDSLRDLKDKELLSRQKVTEMVGQGI